MGFKCGIVGLPNVGKSTLFNALTKSNAEAKNFPFCTISPNTGITPIPDSRLDQLAKIVKPRRILPSTIEFVDIAGLIEGASKGEGLGNQFLINIRETESIGHVVRCFESDHITHVSGRVNPLEDINTVNIEMALADLTTCQRAIHYIQKQNKGSIYKKEKNELEILKKCLSYLEEGEVLRSAKLSEEEQYVIRHFNFLTLKPTMYIANVSEDGFKKNHYLDMVAEFAKKEGSIFIPICASLESDISKLSKNERNELMIELGIQKTGINRIICAAHQLLKLHTYFTAGIKEVRAWTIPIGTTAIQASAKIHTDFEKGFIRAKIISFTDFIRYNGELGARDAGKIRMEGKDYIVQDGDIIKFLFNL